MDRAGETIVKKGNRLAWDIQGLSTEGKSWGQGDVLNSSALHG